MDTDVIPVTILIPPRVHTIQPFSCSTTQVGTYLWVLPHRIVCAHHLVASNPRNTVTMAMIVVTIATVRWAISPPIRQNCYSPSKTNWKLIWMLSEAMCMQFHKESPHWNQPIPSQPTGRTPWLLDTPQGRALCYPRVLLALSILTCRVTSIKHLGQIALKTSCLTMRKLYTGPQTSRRTNTIWKMSQTIDNAKWEM